MSGLVRNGLLSLAGGQACKGPFGAGQVGAADEVVTGAYGGRGLLIWTARTDRDGVWR
jgi:hypothetical protein